MIAVLADHNIKGQAALLWSALATNGWLELGLFCLVVFAEVGLPRNSSDRTVWRYVQASSMLLLTGNRNMDGADSLEQTIREENHPGATPVITISNLDRMAERAYRELCADKLAEVVIYLENYLGIGRVFIP
jgi:hypothetical protein